MTEEWANVLVFPFRSNDKLLANCVVIERVPLFTQVFIGEASTMNTTRCTTDNGISKWSQSLAGPHNIQHEPPRTVCTAFIPTAISASSIGCEKLLKMMAGRLGVAVLAINNANAIRTVRGLIWSRYRAHSKFIKETFEQGNKCAKCNWMLVRGRTSLQRPACWAQHRVVALKNTSVAACWRYAAAATQI